MNMRPQQGFLPASVTAFAQHGAGGANAGSEFFFLVPGPAKAVGVAWVLPLASGKHGVCTAFSVS